MQKAAVVNAAGASFKLLNPKKTMLKSTKPVIAICAVRTGSGKSQTTRRITNILKEKGKKVVVVRHPMPYGDLAKQEVQRYAELEDMDKHECTIEEREEYEHHINNGAIVYAGVDYEKILRQAEQEADVVLWDGGNNDTPFYNPDLFITIADPHRPGHEKLYYPGQINVLLADVVIINKIDTAEKEKVDIVRKNIKELNPNCVIIDGASPVTVENPEIIKDKVVIVVEDGPTLTHGGMAYGAGVVAAKQACVKDIIDPRKYALGSITETYNKYPTTGNVLPAMGYGDKQMQELQETINNAECEAVVIGTPIDLGKLININKPSTRVTYELRELTKPDLKEMIEKKLNI